MTKRFSATAYLVIALFAALAALFNANQQVAAQDAYPPPNQPSAEAAGPDAYPALESELAPDSEPREIETIGDGREGDPFSGLIEQQAAQPVTQEPPSSSGGIFLWGSFVAALIVFITAVVGSIVLFTRRNDA